MKTSDFFDMVQSFFEDCTDEEAINVSALYLIENIIKLKYDAICKLRNKEDSESK